MIYLLRICLSALLGIFPLYAAAQNETIGRNVIVHQPTCWKGDALLKAALRDGFYVGAEAHSEMPLSKGALLYLVFDQNGEGGIIGSAYDNGQPKQCNLGKSKHWRAAETQMVTASYKPESLTKSQKVCRSLAYILNRIKTAYREVPIGRSYISDKYDSLVSASENGSWSIFLIDKLTDQEDETACFANWGHGFLVKDSRFMQVVK